MSDRRPMPPYSPAPGNTALEQAGARPLRARDPGRIGPYTPLGLLGCGGMGRVYLARAAADAPGLVAVKVIRPEYAEDPRFRRRFEREASVHARLCTPHAPPLLGSGFEDELLWMATRYLPGLNLADAVRECGALEPAGVWRLVAELGRALSALDAAGVVHRDLKPSNVILSPQGAHVIDFGIAQAVDSSAITSTGNRVGTPAFMAPEYLREGLCDSASDVFSLAGSLIYAATGNAPFGDGTGVDVMHRVAFEEPRPGIMAKLAARDAELAALLSACLSKDPAGRPTPERLTEIAEGRRAAAWPEPLGGRLLARRQACDALERRTGQKAAPGAVPSRAPAPDSQASAPSPARSPVAESGAGRRKRKVYLAVTAGLAVGAVVAGTFFLTRPSLGGTASAAPTAVATARGDDARISPLPGSSASPSSAEGEGKEAGGEEKEAASGKRADDVSPGEGAPSGAAGSPSTAETSGASAGGTGGSSDGGAPTTAPTKTATGPATPPWISRCTHYSGTELTVRGDRGERVLQVQCMLTQRGFKVGDAGVDGQFGGSTLAAVKKFQRAKGLAADGEVGPGTWTALRGST
ncbi:protein kinase domain-containing protein [Streptomyces sp. NPDC003007]